MKRIISIALIAVMMLAMFGCNNSSPNQTSQDENLPQAGDYMQNLMNNRNTWPAGVPEDIPAAQSVEVSNSYRYEDGSWVIYMLCTLKQVETWETALKDAGFKGENGVVSNDEYIVEYKSSADKLSDAVKEKGAETMLVVNIKEA